MNISNDYGIIDRYVNRLEKEKNIGLQEYTTYMSTKYGFYNHFERINERKRNKERDQKITKEFLSTPVNDRYK